MVEGEVKASLQNTLEYKIIGSDRLQIVVGRTHPWFEYPKVSLTELNQTP